LFWKSRVGTSTQDFDIPPKGYRGNGLDIRLVRLRTEMAARKFQGNCPGGHLHLAVEN